MDVVKLLFHFFYFFIDREIKNKYSIYMSMAQKIRILLVKKGNLSEAELARRLNTSPGNFNQKMKRDNFAERELREIGDILGCDVKMVFTDRQTGEET